MFRFNLSDIQSSTLLYATDSLDEMYGVVQPMIQTNGLDALVGLTLSVRIANTDEVVEVEHEDIMPLLRSQKAHASTVTPR